MTLNFTRILDGQGNTTGYNYTGASSVDLRYDVPFITAATGVLPFYRDGRPCFWSQVHIWDDITLPIANSVNVAAFIAGAVSGEISFSKAIDAVDTLTNAGPTEKIISTPLKIESPEVAGFHVELGLGLTVKFEATLASGTYMILDQTAVLEKLTVSSGASFIGGSGMTTRTNLINHGFIGNLQGSVEGDFINDGNPANGNRAIIAGGLSIGSQLLNSGEIEINGGSLNLTLSTTNSGTIIVQNGSINNASQFSTFGTLKLRMEASVE